LTSLEQWVGHYCWSFYGYEFASFLKAFTSVIFGVFNVVVLKALLVCSVSSFLEVFTSAILSSSFLEAFT
ncbi:14201_t:CDS:1, partial [Gigaspora margarita]